MPRGRIGADIDDMFDAADEAGGTLTAQIYEDRSYDGVPVLRQAQKRYRARCAAAAAAEAAADDEAAAPPAKRRKPVPPVTARAGVSTQTPARSTKHQTQVQSVNKRSRDVAFGEAHKAATAEADAARRAGKLRRKGSTLQDIAAKHDAKLSPLSLRRITASALHAWHKAGRKAGASPKQSGPAVSRARKALIVRIDCMCCEYDYKFVHCNAKSVYECTRS